MRLLVYAPPKEYSHQGTAGYINFIVESITNKKYNLNGFNLNPIELLIRTLDYDFKIIETSKIKIRENNWNNFSILAYVQPGDKYWTNNIKWIKLKKRGAKIIYINNYSFS
jgi:hypothetical protein